MAVTTMNRVGPAISACSTVTGVVFVAVVFSSDGTPASVDVEGSGYSASTLACVREEAAKARLQPFRAPSFTIKFPYRLAKREAQ